MIKCEKGDVTIDGTILEVTTDLACIISEFLDVTSEHSGTARSVALFHKACEVGTTEWMKESLDEGGGDDD